MRIGVLAARTGFTTKTIRFYESAGLLPEPPRTVAGYRDYPPGVVSRLSFIRAAQAAGLSLAEIRGVLGIRDAGHAPCRHVSELISQHLRSVEQRIDELCKARIALSELSRRAVSINPADCAQTEICSILPGAPTTT